MKHYRRQNTKCWLLTADRDKTLLYFCNLCKALRDANVKYLLWFAVIVQNHLIDSTTDSNTFNVKMLGNGWWRNIEWNGEHWMSVFKLLHIFVWMQWRVTLWGDLWQIDLFILLAQFSLVVGCWLLVVSCQPEWIFCAIWFIRSSHRFRIQIFNLKHK